MSYEERAGRPRRSLTAGEERQPIHAFAATMGLLFLLAAVAGFIPGITSNDDELTFAGPDSEARLFGLFEVSVLHNIVHLLFAVGLLAAARVAWSLVYLIGGGIAYLGVFLFGVLVVQDSDANFLPINDADNLLHLGLGLLMIALGIAGSRLSSNRPAT